MNPDDLPRVRGIGAGGEVFEFVINDSKHFDDFEPARIVCGRCGHAFEVMRGEVVVTCPKCMAFNRGHGQLGGGEPLF